MKKEIAAMVVKDLKANLKKEKIITFEKAKGDDELYDLVRGGKAAMMVQRADEDHEYVPRRKVIMMISSESDDGFSPKRPSGNKDTKKSEKPIRDENKSESPIRGREDDRNCVFGSSSSTHPLEKSTEQRKGSPNKETSTFTTSSSSSDSSSDSSSESSSSEGALKKSPESERIKKAQKRAKRKAVKRGRRNEQTASQEHASEQIGLALQKQHYLLDKVTERLGSQQQTLDLLAAELVDMREQAEVSRKQREDQISSMERKREIERQKMLGDARRRERGYQRMREESVRRAQNYDAFKKAKIDTHGKDNKVESSARAKRKRAERRRDARMACHAKPVLHQARTGAVRGTEDRFKRRVEIV